MSFLMICTFGFLSIYILKVNLTDARGYAPNETSSLCAPCASGRFAQEALSSSCSACVAGRFSAALGASEQQACQLCAPGSASSEGQSACEACAPGRWMDRSGQTACEACVAGTASSQRGATTEEWCLFCDIGNYSTSGSSRCSQCPGGRYSAERGAGFCASCGQGQYTSGAHMAGVSHAAGPLRAPVAAWPALPAAIPEKRRPVAWRPAWPAPPAEWPQRRARALARSAPLGDGSRRSERPGNWAPKRAVRPCEATGCTECAAGTSSSMLGSAAGWQVGLTKPLQALYNPPKRPETSSCAPCALGRFSLPAAESCTPCLAGSYGTDQGLSTCRSAPSASGNGRLEVINAHRAPTATARRS